MTNPFKRFLDYCLGPSVDRQVHEVVEAIRARGALYQITCADCQNQWYVCDPEVLTHCCYCGRPISHKINVP